MPLDHWASCIRRLGFIVYAGKSAAHLTLGQKSAQRVLDPWLSEVAGWQRDLVEQQNDENWRVASTLPVNNDPLMLLELSR